ncbi:MAG: flagellar assembly protein FliH [Treponema sp.]|jgi:flagellar assembly protein FliH|nr:flagellar assembly protein FliH [Treponema sp.]
MAKAVFRPGEVTVSDSTVFLELPGSFSEPEHPASGLPSGEDTDMSRMFTSEMIEEYSGPTADELRQEAEDFKIRWEAEKEAMLRAARAEAEALVKEAEKRAVQERERAGREAEEIKRSAESEAERVIAGARQKAEDMAVSARDAFESERQKAEAEGREAGQEAGFAEGRAEVQRLVERTHTVLERAQDKRIEILEETEQQIIDLVLLIARKVIKVVSESQRTVVISNVVQALRKLKTGGNILIRVNLADVKLTTEHIKDFIKIAEGAKGIQVAEDPTVDPGGCVIETDFGEINARISSQLAELEDKILAMSPIKGRAKNAAEGV